MTVEDVLDQLGGYGRFQVLVYIALGLVNMRGAWHVFVTIFTAWAPSHHCSPPANHTLNQSLPWDGELEAWSQCVMYAEPGGDGVPHGNETWDLVCDDNYLTELSVTLYMVGATCGTLFLTPLSDLWGRKTVMLACLWLQAGVGVGLAWTQSAVPFVVLQFFIGITNMTIALCAYVLIVETFDSKTREYPALSLQFFWAGGIMSLSLFAYLLPEWRYLQMTVSLPQVLTVAYFWLLPESLTWLLVKGKINRAKQTILRIIRVNRLPPFENLDATLKRFESGVPQEKSEPAKQEKSDSTKDLVKREDSQESSTVLDLFRTPRLRMFSIFMFYLYLVNSLAYFGISFSMPSLNGDKYLNFFISGVVEIPAYIICLFCNHRVGRRWPMCVFLVVCAVANTAVIFTPDETDDGTDLTALKTTLVMVGKFGITGSYAALYLYGAEIFPTAIRNHAVGLCSFFENIGSIAAPQIVYAAKTLTKLPMTVFAVMTVLGAVMIVFLPETHNTPLPHTLREAENRGRPYTVPDDTQQDAKSRGRPYTVPDDTQQQPDKNLNKDTVITRM
nr:hypothetical protein BaRGS_006124 [Batillaria attramentaria]